MPFFGRKKRENVGDKMSFPDDLPPLSALDLPPAIGSEEPRIKKEPEKSSIAPLFVKIDRYRQILTTIGNLKTALMIVKNSIDTLDQIEKVRDSTFGIIKDVVDKMDEKLIKLDNDLLRPAGFHETTDTSAEERDIRSIEATVADLKGQIDQLKSELGKMI